MDVILTHIHICLDWWAPKLIVIQRFFEQSPTGFWERWAGTNKLKRCSQGSLNILIPSELPTNRPRSLGHRHSLATLVPCGCVTGRANQLMLWCSQDAPARREQTERCLYTGGSILPASTITAGSHTATSMIEKEIQLQYWFLESGLLCRTKIDHIQIFQNQLSTKNLIFQKFFSVLFDYYGAIKEGEKRKYLSHSVIFTNKTYAFIPALRRESIMWTT